jgi:hypothetical protein
MWEPSLFGRRYRISIGERASRRAWQRLSCGALPLFRGRILPKVLRNICAQLVFGKKAVLKLVPSGSRSRPRS